MALPVVMYLPPELNIVNTWCVTKCDSRVLASIPLTIDEHLDVIAPDNTCVLLPSYDSMAFMEYTGWRVFSTQIITHSSLMKNHENHTCKAHDDKQSKPLLRTLGLYTCKACDDKKQSEGLRSCTCKACDDKEQTKPLLRAWGLPGPGIEVVSLPLALRAPS